MQTIPSWPATRARPFHGSPHDRAWRRSDRLGRCVSQGIARAFLIKPVSRSLASQFVTLIFRRAPAQLFADAGERFGRREAVGAGLLDVAAGLVVEDRPMDAQPAGVGESIRPLGSRDRKEGRSTLLLSPLLFFPVARLLCGLGLRGGRQILNPDDVQ